MAKGWVTTARGESLNIDQLIIESKRPPGLKERGSQIKKRKIAGKRKPLNVRGKPVSTAGITTPTLPRDLQAKMDRKKPSKKSMPPPKVSYREGEEAETVADITGIKVKRTEAAVERQKMRIATERNTAPEDTESPLDEVMKELDAEEAPKPAPRKRTPRKKTT